MASKKTKPSSSQRRRAATKSVAKRAPLDVVYRGQSRTKKSVEKFRRPAGLSGATGELGHSGLKQRHGKIEEEFLPELKGSKGFKVYREMSENDEGIGAVLFAVSMLIRQATVLVKAFEEGNESDQKTADFVKGCFDDMSHSAQDLMTEILTMLPYGWSMLETVYKKREGQKLDRPGESSQHEDGLMGWRKMALRPQDSLDHWEMDATGGIRGMWQKAEGVQPKFLPITKCLLFRTLSNKNNPEGRSMLRTAYRPWYFKKRIQEIEGIGVERDLAGLPVLQPAEGLDLWNADDANMVRMKREAETIVQNIRNDDQAGIVLPFGWVLTLLSTEGQRTFDTSKIIDRYSTGIAMTVLADFIILGHNNRYGSFALAGAKTHMFGMAIGGWLEAISTVFNRYAIPRLLAINGMDIGRPPKMSFTDVEIPDLAALGAYIANLRKAGFKMFPNVVLEKKLLEYGNLPTEGVNLGQEGDEADEAQKDRDAAEEAAERSAEQEAANAERDARERSRESE